MFLPFYTVYFFSSQSIIVRLLLLLYGPTWRQFVNGRLLWNSQFHSGRMRESWWIERWSRQPSLTDIHHFLVAALIVVCCFVLNFVLVCFLFFFQPEEQKTNFVWQLGKLGHVVADRRHLPYLVRIPQRITRERSIFFLELGQNCDTTPHLFLRSEIVNVPQNR